VSRWPAGRPRPATPADAVSLAALDAATSTQPWAAAVFAEELARDDRRYLVAEDDGTVIGYGGIAMLAGDAHVMGLAVGPDGQGEGHGAALLDALLVAAADAGCVAVTLEVRPSNEPARRLYRRAGFEEAGRRPGYYPDGEEALLLWRRDLPAPRPPGAATSRRPT
jgi:[ribosomal protein S18]-alanine N-acetyltransferase